MTDTGQLREALIERTRRRRNGFAEPAARGSKMPGSRNH